LIIRDGVGYVLITITISEKKIGVVPVEFYPCKAKLKIVINY